MGAIRDSFTSRQPGIQPAAKHCSSRSSLPGRSPPLLRRLTSEQLIAHWSFCQYGVCFRSEHSSPWCISKRGKRFHQEK